MYCGQCGAGHNRHARFCGSCGQPIVSPVTNNESQTSLHRTEQRAKDTSEFATYSRKIKQELSGLPLITLIGDSVKGASGLHELQEELKRNPKSALLWMHYYEASVTHNKISRGTSVARMIYNPIGYTVSKGVSSGLNAVDDQYEVFDPQRCLLQAVSLCIKSLEEKRSTSEEQVVLGKSLYYLGLNCPEPNSTVRYFERAIKSINLSLMMNQTRRHQAETFFYLSQVYQAVGNRPLQLRSLNLSRKLGFKPGQEILLKELRSDGVDVTPYTNDSNKNDWVAQYRYTYTQNWEKRLDQSFDYVMEAQGEKLKNTAKRLKNFFNI